MARSALAYLADLDTAELTDGEQADLVLGLAAAESGHVAAMAHLLSGLDASGAFAADGCPTARAWLRWHARSTGPAAGVWMSWARMLRGHQRAAALAGGRLSPPWARQLCEWLDLLPEDARADAEQILLEVADAGCELRDLAALAEEIRARTARPDADGAEDRFGARRLRLSRHYQGHARLDGDLTPEAGAALRTVLDALCKRTGPEDLRSPAQRDHDALHQLCQRVIADGVPDTAGQHTTINVHMTLSQLLGQPEADPAAAAWIIASGVPAPPGADCDARVVPIVTGTVDHDLLDQLARSPLATVRDRDRETRALNSARELILSQAIRLLSGPGGLAAWLRTSTLSGPVAAISLPLDIGRGTEAIPAHLRKAIARRSPHCEWPGCDRRAAQCEVHHLIPRSEGGPTNLSNCCTLCWFHHHIATARNPDGTKTLHSHGPPIRAA